ncbi:MAG: hypothetical protein ABH967_00105 [Patescibacteria group bacterium]
MDLGILEIEVYQALSEKLNTNLWRHSAQLIIVLAGHFYLSKRNN